jgi:transposase
MSNLTCGIDWADDHHDVAVVDAAGVVVAERRVTNNPDGFVELVELLAACGEHPGELTPVAIESSKGLFVATLVASGRAVFAINPLATSRYRDRHRSSRAKSDAVDAIVLANILRTDRHQHRPMPDDSDEVRALRVLTRAQQDAVWDRVRMTNRVRSLLKQFFPAALAAFERGGKHRLDSPACRTILTAASTPAAAAKLSQRQLQTLLTRAGRTRGVAAEAERLQSHLRVGQLRQPEPVERAMGQQLAGLIAQLDAICSSVDALTAAAEELFAAQPAASILASFPGVGPLTGARLLAEIGDDANRFADARALKAYTGAAPITRSSGKAHWVGARRAKNDRIAAAGYVWAMAAIRHDPGCRAHYQQRRDRGDRHTAALRNLFNRLVGKLHHCLTTGQHYDPVAAFGTPGQQAA